MAWVLEDCPDLPKHLVATMIGLANHADENGKGAHPSQPTLAWYTRKSLDSAQRDVDQLEELGLIRRGDQRRVLHLPPDKRPVVYDLAMERRRGPRPERGRAGRPRKEQLTDTPEIGGAWTPPGFSDEESGGHGCEIGGAPVRNRGGVDAPRTVLEPSLNQTPLVVATDRRARPPRPRGGDGGDLLEELTPNPTTPGEGEPDSAVVTIDRMVGEARTIRPTWSRSQIIRAVEAAMQAGRTLPEVEVNLLRLAGDPGTRWPGRLAVLPEADWTAAAAQASRPPARPWCGECEEGTRLFDLGDTVIRCPKCHPLAGS